MRQRVREITAIGRRILIHSRFVGGSSRNNGGAAIVLIAIGLMVVGYVGLFFGRWIKAAVSRQREYLADASAVQFTRDPTGIGGALKNRLAVRVEENSARNTFCQILLQPPGWRASHLIAKRMTAGQCLKCLLRLPPSWAPGR